MTLAKSRYSVAGYVKHSKRMLSIAGICFIAGLLFLLFSIFPHNGGTFITTSQGLFSSFMLTLIGVTMLSSSMSGLTRAIEEIEKAINTEAYRKEFVEQFANSSNYEK